MLKLQFIFYLKELKLPYSLHVKNENTKIISFNWLHSSTLDCFSITRKLHESFPAPQTSGKNIIINEINEAHYYRQLKYLTLVERNFILALSYRVTRTWSLCLYFFKCCFLLDTMRGKYSYISDLNLHFICMWPKTFSTISSWLECIKNSVICCRTHPKVGKYSQNLFVTYKAQKEFDLISVIEFNRTHPKVTKFHILVNKTTCLFPSAKDSNISKGCGRIVEIPDGRWG